MTDLQAYIAAGASLVVIISALVVAARWGWRRVWEIARFVLRLIEAVEHNAAATDALKATSEELAKEFGAHRVDVLQALAELAQRVTVLENKAP
jgi:hypothetical protein